MTRPVVAASIRVFFVLTIALGALAAGTMVSAPAEAKKKSCLQKYRECSSRCARAYSDYVPCINRTCARQHDNCMADSGNHDDNAFAWIWQAPAERELPKSSPAASRPDGNETAGTGTLR